MNSSVPATQRKLWLSLLLVWSVGVRSWAGETAVTVPFKPITLADLPDFKVDTEEIVTKRGLVHTNGLVSTINFENFKSPKINGEQTVVLRKEVTGFREDLELSAIWQPGKAPLVVTLLGFYQKTSHKLAKVWKEKLAESGCHVVAFNSIFRDDCNKCSGHGVAGNISEEAGVVARVLEALLDYQGEKDFAPVKERITGVRLLGTSYGGYVALHLFNHPKAKALAIDRVLVLSTPVKLSTAALHIDRFNREDAPMHGLGDLLKLMDGYTPKSSQPSAEEESLMRAGIGYVFHGDLEKTIDGCNRLYDPGLLDRYKQWEEAPEQKEQYRSEKQQMDDRHKTETDELKNRLENGDKELYKQEKRSLEQRHAIEKGIVEKRLSKSSHWSFYDFVERLCAPYWGTKPEDLWAKGDLTTLLEKCPDCVQAVIAEDDPLNSREELAALRQKVKEPKLIVLPYGGHLGYAGTRWVGALIEKFFK